MSDIRQQFQILRGREFQLQKEIKTNSEDLQKLRVDQKRHEQALTILRTVGLETQRQLQFHISDITSMALEAVFDEPYTLQVEFVERRNKTECDLIFKRDDHEMDPLTASGGGAVDVAAFALRVASWSMQKPLSRRCIILDEPFRFVSQDLQEKAAQMLSELSARLNLQFIIVTHETILSDYADKSFKVNLRKGISQIK